MVRRPNVDLRTFMIKTPLVPSTAIRFHTMQSAPCSHFSIYLERFLLVDVTPELWLWFDNERAPRWGATPLSRDALLGRHCMQILSRLRDKRPSNAVLNSWRDNAAGQLEFWEYSDGQASNLKHCRSLN
jgi:hypothetical protein